MKTRKVSYTQLGMLFGIFVGGGLSVLLFSVTANAVYFTIAGASVAIGLILGAGFDKRYEADEEKR